VTAPRAAPATAARADRVYRIAGVVVKPLIRRWFRIRVEGEEHIPAAGPAILASNHRSNVDPVVLACGVRRPLFFMAKAELYVFPLGPILRWIGQFPVRRGGVDREALRQTTAVLARGDVLGLFPEGTRGAGRFESVHAGLCYILLRGGDRAAAGAPAAPGCPVLPVAIFGTERVRRRLGWLPLASPVRIVVGAPIELPGPGAGRTGRRAATEALRGSLQRFLAAAETAQAAPGRRRERPHAGV
jgi:1-acyl-sn-glycerol-3-phosphate acyltransferase